MKTLLSTIIVLFVIIFWSIKYSGDVDIYSRNNYSCSCDTIKIKEHILSKEYLEIPKYDKSSFMRSSFYEISAKENRLLWFRDIESPDTTKFTSLWNDYVSSNYRANNKDFLKYYQDKDGIEMAFQLGPAGMMWTYYSFVVKKIKCCYVVTRSAFTHARFRYKAYAILSESEMENMREVFKYFEDNPIPIKEEYGYHGYFVDNKFNKKFFIDFEKQIDSLRQPNKEILRVYNLLGDSIKWKKMYSL